MHPLAWSTSIEQWDTLFAQSAFDLGLIRSLAEVTVQRSENSRYKESRSV